MPNYKRYSYVPHTLIPYIDKVGIVIPSNPSNPSNMTFYDPNPYRTIIRNNQSNPLARYNGMGKLTNRPSL